MDLFIWYRPNSYFYPHWSSWLASRGFETLCLDLKDKDSNARALARVESIDGNLPCVLMTVGEIPFDLPTIRRLSRIQSVVFVSDDEWHFIETGRCLPLYFDRVVTNYPPRIKGYLRHGSGNVMASGYAANPLVFRKTTSQKRFDVLMIGAAHPDRVRIVREIAASEIPIQVFGAGWAWYSDLVSYWGGVLSTKDMVDAISAARVVINSGFTPSGVPQIKGRLFETAACGSFQLVASIPGLGEYYEVGKEVDSFKNDEELIRKIHYYLDNELERESMAHAAYQRILLDHTWDQRLDEMLDEKTDLVSANSADLRLIS